MPDEGVMSMIKGRVWKYGDDVNTDVIFPGKYTYTISDPKEMAEHALEDLDPRFAREVRPGDIIVAGKNWGNGSSREQAVTCLKEAGVAAIVARSFARIYGRNCINSALPALTCPDAVDAIQEGEVIEIDLGTGEIRCAAGTFHFPPWPPNVLAIVEAGGLVNYARQQLAARLMLDWLGETEKAAVLEKAIAAVIREGKVRTYEMGGSNTTLEVAQAVAERNDDREKGQ